MHQVDPSEDKGEHLQTARPEKNLLLLPMLHPVLLCLAFAHDESNNKHMNAEGRPRVGHLIAPLPLVEVLAGSLDGKSPGGERNTFFPALALRSELSEIRRSSREP